MDEHLDLYAATLRDGLYFLQRELAREDDADKPQLLHGENTFQVVGDELRGCVEREGRKILPREPSNAEILHDDTVRAKLVEDRQLLDGGRKLVVVHERVEGDVHLLAAGCARVCDQLSQLVRGEVDGFGARREGVEPKVYGIRARREGGAGCLKGAGWC